MTITKFPIQTKLLDAGAIEVASFKFKSSANLLASPRDGGGVDTTWQAGPYLYREAAPDASDHHLTTSGGVKLYVLPNSDGCVTPQQFGAVADGVADDTAAVHAAIAWAVDRGGQVLFPLGTYRVTAGFTRSTAYRELRLSGVNYGRESLSNPHLRMSRIVLDSADPNSFFFSTENRGYIKCEYLVFACAQYVMDRQFFKWSGGGANHFFESVGFEDVEKPICYNEGCYFENAAFRDVSFANSGMIHSRIDGPGETTRLRGTFLYIENSKHNGGVPVNSEKIVCDLTGIRNVRGTNVVIQGALPSNGDWTVLKLWNPFDSDYVRHTLGSFNGLHIEWAGNAAQYWLHQISGIVSIYDSRAIVSQSSKNRLDDYATLSLIGCTFGTAAAFDTHFELSSRSRVLVTNCGGRTWPQDPRITLTNFKLLDQNNAEYANSVVTSHGNIPLYSYKGGAIPSSLFLSTGTVTFTTDAVYGRKIVTESVTGNTVAFVLRCFGMSKFQPSDQIVVSALVKVPDAASGEFQVRLLDTADTALFIETVPQGILYELRWSGSLADITSDEMRIMFTGLSMVGITSPLEIYSLDIQLGTYLPQTVVTQYPDNTEHWATAAPTTGSWLRGDKVWNSAPSPSGVLGWICTTAGTPGTWKSLGTIAA